MGCFTVERFREEGYSLKEFLEEVYMDSRHGGSKRAEEIYQELLKIREALEYREVELQSITEEETSKEEIEEIADSLSLVDISVSSKEYLKIFADKTTAEKKSRFIEYLERAEDGSILEEIKSSEENWVEIAEFLGVIRKIEEIEDAVRDAVHGCATYLTAEAKKKYSRLVEEGKYREAGDIAGALFYLECKGYPVECLLKGNTVKYNRTYLQRIELVEPLRAHSIAKYLDSVQEEIEKKMELCREILLQREGVDEEEYFESAYRLFKKVAEGMLAPVVEEIWGAEDPFEFLCKLEYVVKRVRLIKEEGARIVPRYREKIGRLELVRVSAEECVQKEMEGTKNLLENFLSVLKGKSSTKYVLRGESAGAEPKSADEVLFRYLAACRRSLERGAVLGYGFSGYEELLRSQMVGHSLLISKICEEGEARPFLALSLHLCMYLCVKQMYKDSAGQENAEAVHGALQEFTNTEDRRSKTIFHREKNSLMKTIEKSVEEIDSGAAVEALKNALKYLDYSVLSDYVTETVLSEVSEKIKIFLFSRSSAEEIKKIIYYVKDIRKYAASLEVVSAEKTLSRIKTLGEALLVNKEDVKRVLDSISATNEEILIVRKSRTRMG